MVIQDRIRRCLILENIRKYPKIASRAGLVDGSGRYERPVNMNTHKNIKINKHVKGYCLGIIPKFIV